MKKLMKTLPFYGDIIVYKFKIKRSTFVIGLALPDGIELRYPCYYLYRYNRRCRGRYEQLVGSPDTSYIFRYLLDRFLKS